MALGDIVGQLPGFLRRAKVSDGPDSNDISVAERLTTQKVHFQKTAADAAGATATDDAFFYTDHTYKLLSARYIPHAALTADNTNYATLSVWNGTTTYCSQTTQVTGSDDWTDNVHEDLPVSTANIASGTTLRFRIQKAGSGVVVPVGVLELLLAERIA